MFTTLIFWNVSTLKQALQIIYEIKYQLKVEILHWKPSRKFKVFIKSHKLTEYRHGVKVGPGPWIPGPNDPPSKFKSGTPGPPSKFKGRAPGPPSKFKSGTLVITFLHCLTYLVLDKYIIWKQFSTNSRYSKLYSLFWTHPTFSWNLKCHAWRA